MTRSQSIRPVVRNTCRVWAVVGCLGAVGLLAPTRVSANMVQQIVVSKCAEAMKAEFSKAGKTPPPGMVDFTCNCVADGMLKRRQTLDAAKASCTAQATQKFGQP